MTNNWNDKPEKIKGAARKAVGQIAVQKKPAVAAKGKARPTDEEIAARAFAIWEKQGRPEGQQMDNWLQAERELTEE